MKIKEINKEKDEIYFVHCGRKIVGTYSAYVGKYGFYRIRVGKRIYGSVCDWGGGRWEPAWSEEGEGSISRLKEIGREILFKESLNLRRIFAEDLK